MEGTRTITTALALSLLVAAPASERKLTASTAGAVRGVIRL
jgi:hypothetical protein